MLVTGGIGTTGFGDSGEAEIYVWDSGTRVADRFFEGVGLGGLC